MYTETGVLQNEYNSYLGDVFVTGDSEDKDVFVETLIATVKNAPESEVVLNAVAVATEYDRKGIATIGSVATPNRSYSSAHDDIYVVVEYKISGYTSTNSVHRQIRDLVIGQKEEEEKARLKARRAELENQRAALLKQIEDTDTALSNLEN